LTIINATPTFRFYLQLYITADGIPPEPQRTILFDYIASEYTRILAQTFAVNISVWVVLLQPQILVLQCDSSVAATQIINSIAIKSGALFLDVTLDDVVVTFSPYSVDVQLTFGILNSIPATVANELLTLLMGTATRIFLSVDSTNLLSNFTNTANSSVNYAYFSAFANCTAPQPFWDGILCSVDTWTSFDNNLQVIYPDIVTSASDVVQVGSTTLLADFLVNGSMTVQGNLTIDSSVTIQVLSSSAEPIIIVTDGASFAGTLNVIVPQNFVNVSNSSAVLMSYSSLPTSNQFSSIIVTTENGESVPSTCVNPDYAPQQLTIFFSCTAAADTSNSGNTPFPLQTIIIVLTVVLVVFIIVTGIGIFIWKKQHDKKVESRMAQSV